MKQKIKIADIMVNVLPKRCRKFRLSYLEGLGYTTEESINNLRKSFESSKIDFKEYEFIGQLRVYDAEKERGFITRPIFPTESDNLEKFDACILEK